MTDAPSFPALTVHHVGIAVRDIDEAMLFYKGKLGLQIKHRVNMPDHGLELAFIDAGNTYLELLQPTDPEGTVARFIERRGPGLHHLCFNTDDLAQHLADLAANNVELIDAAPRAGALADVAFLHPSSANGVLVELTQHPPDA